MARTKSRISEQVPSLKNWGGVRSISRRLERSATIVENREAVAYSLLCMANTKITDVLTWDEDGNVKVKAASQIPDLLCRTMAGCCHHYQIQMFHHLMLS